MKKRKFVVFGFKHPKRSLVPGSFFVILKWCFNLILLQHKLDVIRIDLRDWVPTGTWAQVKYLSTHLCITTNLALLTT